MSKRRGLPTESHMRHDSHFVDSLSERFGPSLGRQIPIDEIITNPDQPRRSVGDLSELKASIESKGVLEPILVRPLADGRFRIIAGERRFRAALEAGLAEVPCIELDVPDNEMMEIALIENLHRRDLHAFEEAMGYASLAEQARLHAAADRRDGGEVARLDHRSDVSPRHPGRPSRGMSARRHRREIGAPRDRETRRSQEDGRGDRGGPDGSTRDDLRDSKKVAGSGKIRGRTFRFVYQPKDGPFKLNISFAKSRVAARRAHRRPARRHPPAREGRDRDAEAPAPRGVSRGDADRERASAIARRG